jgi:transposase
MQELAEVRAHLAALQKKRFLPSSEKMPPMPREVKKLRPANADEAKALRVQNQNAKKSLPTEIIDVPVPEASRSCPCNAPNFKEVGNGTPAVTYHYIAAHFRRIIYRRQTLACATCRSHLITAEIPGRLFDRSPYSPSFIAEIIVQKCEDGIPLYRIAKQFERQGIPMARSTMTDLFHRAADLLSPISQRMVERIRESYVVFADETTLKMQVSEKRAFMWTFLGASLTGFMFSPTRSGDVPMKVLGGSEGWLMVDLYTGYNKVTSSGNRMRAGCLAHARRKIFDAKDHNEALEALALIRDIYVVEHDAESTNLSGTEQHLAMRKTLSRPLMAKLLLWARRESKRHGPKSLLGKATGYLLRNRKPLTRFLDVIALPPDNNRSEAALRRVALGRKNYLFVQDEDSGENLAGLFSIIASCVQNKLNPVQYIHDVLIRLGEHPNQRIDELLPDRWKPVD